MFLKDLYNRLVGSVLAFGRWSGWGCKYVNMHALARLKPQFQVGGKIAYWKSLRKSSLKDQQWARNSRSWIVVYLMIMFFHSSKASWEEWEYSHIHNCRENIPQILHCRTLNRNLYKTFILAYNNTRWFFLFYHHIHNI